MPPVPIGAGRPAGGTRTFSRLVLELAVGHDAERVGEAGDDDVGGNEVPGLAMEERLLDAPLQVADMLDRGDHSEVRRRRANAAKDVSNDTFGLDRDCCRGNESLAVRAGIKWILARAARENRPGPLLRGA